MGWLWKCIQYWVYGDKENEHKNRESAFNWKASLFHYVCILSIIMVSEVETLKKIALTNIFLETIGLLTFLHSYAKHCIRIKYHPVYIKSAWKVLCHNCGRSACLFVKRTHCIVAHAVQFYHRQQFRKDCLSFQFWWLYLMAVLVTIVRF